MAREARWGVLVPWREDDNAADLVLGTVLARAEVRNAHGYVADGLIVAYQSVTPHGAVLESRYAIYFDRESRTFALAAVENEE